MLSNACKQFDHSDFDYNLEYYKSIKYNFASFRLRMYHSLSISIIRSHTKLHRKCLWIKKAWTKNVCYVTKKYFKFIVYNSVHILMQTLLQYAPKGQVDNITIKQLMVLCRQERNPFLKQYQSKSIMPLGVTSHNVLINTFRQRETYPNYGNVIYKFIFNENAWISIKISLKFVPKGPIKIFLHLVQMAWRQPGDKPLSEPMVFSLLTHICVAQPQWVNSM